MQAPFKVIDPPPKDPFVAVRERLRLAVLKEYSIEELTAEINEKLAPNEEGIRACLRCGKPIRIVEGNGNEAFCVEVNPAELGAEYGKLVVKYDMHFKNCKKAS